MEKLETSKTQLEENFNEQNLEFQLMKQELEELKDGLSRDAKYHLKDI